MTSSGESRGGMVRRRQRPGNTALAAQDQEEYDPEMDNDTIQAPAGEAMEAESPLIETELLVEEISIDGMCGVY